MLSEAVILDYVCILDDVLGSCSFVVLVLLLYTFMSLLKGYQENRCVSQLVFSKNFEAVVLFTSFTVQ